MEAIDPFSAVEPTALPQVSGPNLSAFGDLFDILGSLTVGSFISGIIEFLKTFSTVISMVLIIGLVYTVIRLNDLRRKETEALGLNFAWKGELEAKRTRWEEVVEHMNSGNPSDWKIAILDADNLLDEMVKKMGYEGETLGERLKNIEPSDFPNLDAAWEAHKVRNEIAHQGTIFELSRADAERTINQFETVFRGLGYL